ncbi:MAG TPA: hypothetical protein DDW31_00945 [candidate division Zixibacteria bacterium]|nr:hypothetical protein [candidate division Zixibacteria bacterium]
MAFAAARRVSEQPGRLYNPLVVHGGVGLGKTHLLQAVGNAVSESHPDWSVVMLSGGQISRKDLDGAERADLLLIDDLHLCILEREIQIRMIPLFDAMVGTGRQIAATTDTVPQKIDRLDPKLLSRLLGGVIVGLKEIDVNEKALILARKAGARDTEMSEEALLTIASRVPSNVRELEGALNRVLLYASLFDGKVTKNIVDEALPPTAAPAVAAAGGTGPDDQAPGGAAPEAAAGEFGDFITGLDTKVTDLITQEQDAEKLRQEYKEKLYIWRMKGFNTARVERTLDQDISAATREHQAFTDNIERLITLQEEFGNLAPAATPEMIARVEALLFDPDKVDELTLAVQSLKRELVPKLTPQAVPLPPLAGPAQDAPSEPPAQMEAPAPAPPPPPAAQPAAAPARPAPVPPAAPPVPAILEMPARAALAGAVPPGEEMAEAAPANLGLIEENWPRVEDRLMEDI